MLGRVHYRKAGRCLVVLAAIVLLIAPVRLAHPQDESGAPSSNGQTQQPKADESRPTPSPEPRQPVVIPEPEQSKPAVYKPSCDKPEDHNAADYCEQQRMAKAAEDAVWWARFQSGVGVLGFLAIVFTLVLTAQATRATARSADISQKSLQLSQGAFLDLKEQDLKVSLGRDKDSFNIELKIHNAGQTVATIESYRGRYHMGTDLPDRPSFLDSPKLFQSVILVAGDSLVLDEGPNRVNKINKDSLTKILKGELKYGHLTYADVFGNTFDVGFGREVEVDNVEKDKYRFRLPENITATAKYNFYRQRGPYDLSDPSIEFGHFAVRNYSGADGCKIDYSITNIGKSDVVVETTTLRYLHVFALPDVPDYRLPWWPRGKRLKPRNLIPGGVITVRPNPISLGQQTLDDVVKGKRHTYVFGKAIYREGGRRFEVGFVGRVKVTVAKVEEGKTTVRFSVETPPGLAAYNFFRRIPRWGWERLKNY